MKEFKRYASQIILLSTLFLMGACSSADDGLDLNPPPLPDNQNPPTPLPPAPEPSGILPCENGMAGEYPCSGFDLVAHLNVSQLGAASGNDIWGWTDPDTGIEYALMGLDNGTAFISLEDPEAPTFLGKLPSAAGSSPWRDIKVYQDHAFVVSEASGHGMQVFDLTQLRSVNNPPATFSASANYTEFGNAHNIVINDDSGFAYVVGTGAQFAYNGGAHFVNVQDPTSPQAAGGYGASGYTHDAQVVTYQGPDPDYNGREIFIGANENRVVLVDVTDKAQPAFISQLTYPNIGYTHQGWFTEDQRYFLLGDETDELSFGLLSRTLIFDFTDLDDPVLHTTYSGPTTAIDHNGYVLGETFYLANYTAGIRVVDISGIAGRQLDEIGFFDTYPNSDVTDFNGVWSLYPYLESGLILIGDINRGFFAVRPSEETTP